MGWDPIHISSSFEGFVKALELASVPTEEVRRMVIFTMANGERKVVEEYVAEYDDDGRGGRSRAEIVVYKEGERPRFERHEGDDDGSYCQHPSWETSTEYWDSSR